MKKTLILPIALSILLTGTISSAFSCPCPDGQNPPPPPRCHCKMKHCDKKMTKAEFKKMKKENEKKKKEFEKKLNLTKEQKQQLEENRLAGHKQMEPLKQEMKAKFDKMHQIHTSNLSEQEKKKQLDAVKKELDTLKAKTDEIRKQNMKNFESILTEKQKAELQKWKAEHKDMHKHMKHHGMPDGNCPPPAPCNCPPPPVK